jgi:8-hydroxy-5-deazaflavin:NADPH oxidoreductase
MTTIGFIGSGNIGGTVARLSVAAGHHVVLSNSRGPDTLADLVAELGPLATAGTTDQAAEAGGLVVVSIPVKAIGAVPAKPLDGKPVLDTGTTTRSATDSSPSSTTASSPAAACSSASWAARTWSRCSTTSSSGTWRR